ncbi:hypothetical protein KFK09_002441 [Dendrobium nobile]|uniref:Uncharacterized protein n=1 Tax=Dendrobium nobile TaxID=94219 RepID=A0A8T3C3V6_DENNO|nr:hypothetical protein KFK09_002441 [Dendrobium nobile]
MPMAKRLLKFENVWTSYPASAAVVRNAWSKNATGSVSQILNHKLNRTLKALFFWSRSKLKILNQLKENLKKEILVLQTSESENGGLSADEFWVLKTKINELNATLARLNTWWRQRTKVKWMNEGDCNSRFF